MQMEFDAFFFFSFFNKSLSMTFFSHIYVISCVFFVFFNVGLTQRVVLVEGQRVKDTHAMSPAVRTP